MFYFVENVILICQGVNHCTKNTACKGNENLLQLPDDETCALCCQSMPSLGLYVLFVHHGVGYGVTHSVMSKLQVFWISSILLNLPIAVKPLPVYIICNT